MIEDLVDNITLFLKDGAASAIPRPCSEDEISKAETAFSAEFHHVFPEAYKRVLRRANGLAHNGLIIWPAAPESLFQETILQANTDQRENFSDDFIYYGQIDEELYVFDINTEKYFAIEYVGKSVWKKFESAEEMFEFMLKRALE